MFFVLILLVLVVFGFYGLLCGELGFRCCEFGFCVVFGVLVNLLGGFVVGYGMCFVILGVVVGFVVVFGLGFVLVVLLFGVELRSLGVYVMMVVVLVVVGVLVCFGFVFGVVWVDLKIVL